MAFILTVEDLKTHFYAEQVDEITREDATIAEEAIAVAIAEAKGFLSRYDIPALFGTADQDASFIDPNLKAKVKDLARWSLITLANPNISYEDTESRYKMAIKDYFGLIQVGKLQPEGWPYRDTAAIPKPPQGSDVSASSNPKRSNHY